LNFVPCSLCTCQDRDDCRSQLDSKKMNLPSLYTQWPQASNQPQPENDRKNVNAVMGGAPRMLSTPSRGSRSNSILSPGDFSPGLSSPLSQRIERLTLDTTNLEPDGECFARCIPSRAHFIRSSLVSDPVTIPECPCIRDPWPRSLLWCEYFG
jgi:hypothetical protein